MWELVQAGGWLMLPIIICSIMAMGIIAERFWTLQKTRVIPATLMNDVLRLEKKNRLDQKHIEEIYQGSPLGKILASGLFNRDNSRDILKESIEEAGRHVAHDLERFLNGLGTIASITPLLGLLGTVIGMIKVFTAITAVGVGDPGQLAGGISEALITTATGLSVAIPSLIFYRYFRGHIDALIVAMEQEAITLIEVLHGERDSSAL